MSAVENQISTPKVANNTQTNSGAELVMVTGYDLSTAPSTRDFYCKDEQFGTTVLSLQVNGDSLGGTLDGTIQLIESNDGKNWKTLGSAQTLSAATITLMFEASWFACKYIGFRFVKNGLTSGTLESILVTKNG